jgi:hypothetical protein
MSSIDNLLALSTELSTTAAHLSAAATRLTTMATKLQEEAANLAEELSRQWGVDVSVNVGMRPGGAYGRDLVVVKK